MPPVVLGVSILLAASLFLYTLSCFAPPIQPDILATSTTLRFPRSFEDLSGLAALLNHYQHAHLTYVLLLFCSAYLYKQCFAIPGSVFMNVLAGALFGLRLGFPLVCLLTATGASGCYLLSRLFAKRYVERYLPGRVADLQAKVNDHMDSLFFYLLFLRLIPMTPNWILNIASPVVNIPIHYFFFSVLIGLMPYNFVCVRTGCFLAELKSLEDMFTPSTLLQMALVAILALAPAVFKTWRQKRQQLLPTKQD